MLSYLAQLTLRLSTTLAALPEEQRLRHAAFTWQRQQPDGGFCGREGGSDLYYTGFALRLLAILGELQGERAAKAADFLRARLSGRESIVDFFSLIYGAELLNSAAGLDIFSGSGAAWRDQIDTALEKLRRPDGGYAKGFEGMASSTYHTFLVLLCRELIARPAPQPETIVGFLMSQRDVEGGFREIRAGKRASTNPTAAGIAALRMLTALDADTSVPAIDFLADMQTDEGGLRANTRIPIADALSTFTGCLTLQDLGALERVDSAAARRYLQSLELETGGFHGAAWDTATDVEYTFYGLSGLALLGGR